MTDVNDVLPVHQSDATLVHVECDLQLGVAAGPTEFHLATEESAERQSLIRRENDATRDGESTPQNMPKYGKYTLPGGVNYREVLLTLPLTQANARGQEESKRLLDEALALDRQAMDAWQRTGNVEEFNRLNERSRDLRRQATAAEKAAGTESYKYQSSHWDQPNVIAHIRVNDRTDADGSKVLLVEELQSDWGQAGAQARKKKVKRLIAQGMSKEEANKAVPQDFGFADPKARSQLESEIRSLGINKPIQNVSLRDLANAGASQELQGRFDSEMLRGASNPTAAPFVTKTEGWLNLALKRVMIMAAEGGYDKVAFTTGEQNADRFKLSATVSSIRTKWSDSARGERKVDIVTKEPMNVIGLIVDKSGTVIGSMTNGMNGKTLDQVIGKEMAQKVMETEGDGKWSGLDLEVGGEGMKAFYDIIVPTALKKLLPKVGGGQMAQVGVSVEGGTLEGPLHDYYFDARSDEFIVTRADDSAETEVGRFATREEAVAAVDRLNQESASFSEQPGFDITPAMRERIAGGVPMFSNRAQQDQASETAEQAAPTGKQGTERVGKVDTHVLGVERGERAESKVGQLSDEEKAIIAKGAKKAKGVTAAELGKRARDNKRAHPVSAGWSPLTLVKVKVNDNGKADLEYQIVPYDFNTNANGKSLKPGTKEYNQRVNEIAGLMLAEVRRIYDRAQKGDKAAINIIAQSGWYKEMRTRLRQEFGGLGDLFADLLGATSPNTPVRTNWDNSVEALRLATQGKFDNLLPKWIDYFDRLEDTETMLRGFFDEMLDKGMSKAAIKELGEYKWLTERASEARDFPDSLLPVKSNGKKFGFNGYNVARAMVDLWRVVRDADPDVGRGATAPKAINFSGNLIGFRARATIDVWAARMLQRLAGGQRIPSMAEGGVSGSALRSGENTLQFGFGQDVFTAAVNLIRNDEQLQQDPVLAGINDDDLQALVWFIEKEVWTENNWTSAAGEGGSFEFEADLAGVSDRARVNELRREADSSIASTAAQREQARRDIESVTQKMQNYPGVVEAQATLDRNAALVEKGGLGKDRMAEIKAENAQARELMSKAKQTKGYEKLRKELDRARDVLKKPTKEQRKEMRAKAVGELGKMARTVDRFTVGLSIQKGAEQGMQPTPPSDADMAGLASRMVAAVTGGQNADTVIAVKAIATEGLYGSPERALDAEFIVNEKFNPAPLAAATFSEAQDADQDAAFVARVLRPDEKFDPLLHRPGIEIYFRDMNQAEEAARIMAGTLATRVVKPTEFGPGLFSVGGYTIIVDGRPTAEAKAGAMGKPVGMRVIYMPEFEARYGMDPRLANASENNIRDIVKERADDLGNFASEILRKFDGVSFAGRFDYEVDTRFAGEYQGAIDGYTSAAPAGGTDQGRGKAWQGRPVGESIAAAVGRLPLDGSQPGAAVLDRGDTEVRFSRRAVADGDGGGRGDSAGPAPLPGAPIIQGATGPDPRIVAVAEQYARDNGIELKRQAEYVRVDPDRAVRIMSAYEAMPHAPNDPKVKEAYDNLIRQTTAQYRALEAAGYKFWFIDPKNDPYKSPWDALRDLRSKQSMGVFSTADGFGSEESDSGFEGNLMEAETDILWPYGSPDGELRTVLANDLFRAVHDAFGHGLEGAGFRDHGEENAWQAHARLFTGSAVGAITSETRGQNSWLNFKSSPLREMVGDDKAAQLHPDNWRTITVGEHNRTAKVEDTVFAPQKTGLMPKWTWTEGVVGDAPAFSNRAAPQMGVNVASDSAAGRRYADLIVDGEKTYESRETNSLRSYVGKRVAIVRTGEGQAKAIGAVTIGEPIEVDEAGFRELEGEHMVPAGSKFDIKPGQKKLLYPLTNPERFEEEYDVGAGIVSRKVLDPKISEVAGLFRDLQGARGLKRVRALEKVDAHPMAETIRRIDQEFMDILERLDDAGLVKINCK